MEESLDKYQLAGLDTKERGFSRPVICERAGEGYRAILRYETVLCEAGPHQSQDEALRTLVQTLHCSGYRQLRTQMSFRNGIYLGSQEMWVEYPDPAPEPEPIGFIEKFINRFRPRSSNQ